MDSTESEEIASDIIEDLFKVFKLRDRLHIQRQYLKDFPPDAEINEHSLRALRCDYTQARKKLEKRLGKVLCTCSCSK